MADDSNTSSDRGAGESRGHQRRRRVGDGGSRSSSGAPERRDQNASRPGAREKRPARYSKDPNSRPSRHSGEGDFRPSRYSRDNDSRPSRYSRDKDSRPSRYGRDGDSRPGRSGDGRDRDGGRRTPRYGDDRGPQRRADSPGRAQNRASSRPGQDARAQRLPEPPVPEGITGRELSKEIHDELRGLSKETAERVAQHMVAAYALEDENPAASQEHAQFAVRIGGRIGAVREASGILAYRAGDYQTATRELRTALRITGRADVLPMIADAERGLGRPERALDLAASDAAAGLGVDATIELMIVVAGAYADTGDIETALRTLEMPALRHKVNGRWQVRLWVAYSDLLERSGRAEDAHRWLTLAADADTEGLTDAAERLGRPAPAPQPSAAWEDDEEISVLDAYSDEDDTADPEPSATPEMKDAQQ